MDKKTAIIVLAAIIFVIALFFIDARFGIFKKVGKQNNQTSLSTKPDVDFRLAKKVVVATYTGILPSEKCGDLETTLILKDEGEATLVQTNGTCKKEARNTVLNSTYTSVNNLVTVSLENGEKFSFKQEGTTLLLDGTSSGSKKITNKNTKFSLEKTNISNYTSDDKTKIAQAEYASFGATKIAKVAFTGESSIVLREEASGVFKNLVHTWSVVDNSATFTSATSTIIFRKE